jgi:hypothetical protein
LKSAIRDARRIDREGIAWCVPFAELVHAGVAKRQGNLVNAARLFNDSARHFDAIDLQLFSAVARYREGECTGGIAGQELIAASEKWMTDEGIKSPTRMTAMLAP